MSDSERRRLEALWAGEFGDQYTDRNIEAHRGRQGFWRATVDQLGVESALEIGCNTGANLRWLAQLLGESAVAGVDVNGKALELLGEALPEADLRQVAAADLPFAGRSFDLVFTMGVLIHQPPETLPLVMAEIVRCADKYVICGEYYAEELVEVPYRGQSGALFKQDYGALYQRLHPQLTPVDQGFLPRGESSWDDLAYWILKRR